MQKTVARLATVPSQPRAVRSLPVGLSSPRSFRRPRGSKPRSPRAAASQALPVPRSNPCRPAGVPAAWRPTRPVRKEEPARRPQRGALTSTGGGCGPGSRLPAPGRPPRTLRPSPRRQPRRAWPRPLSFSLTTVPGKRKRNLPRGGTGPERAGSAGCRPAARGGGLGPRVCARPAERPSGRSPDLPRERWRTSRPHLPRRGPGRDAGGRGAGQRVERPAASRPVAAASRICPAASACWGLAAGSPPGT